MFKKFKIVHLIEVFLIFGNKSLARNLKNRWVDFHKMCTAGTSQLVDVQCKFMFKSDHRILSYGQFKILAHAWVCAWSTLLLAFVLSGVLEIRLMQLL